MKSKSKKKQESRNDFTMQIEGSIYLLILSPGQPKRGSKENVGKDNGYQPYWPTAVIEHRYIAGIVAGIENDGLRLTSDMGPSPDTEPESLKPSDLKQRAQELVDPATCLLSMTS